MSEENKKPEKMVMKIRVLKRELGKAVAKSGKEYNCLTLKYHLPSKDRTTTKKFACFSDEGKYVIDRISANNGLMYRVVLKLKENGFYEWTDIQPIESEPDESLTETFEGGDS